MKAGDEWLRRFLQRGRQHVLEEQRTAHLERPALSPTGTCGRTWGKPSPDLHRCDREPHGMKKHECACGTEMSG